MQGALREARRITPEGTSLPKELASLARRHDVNVYALRTRLLGEVADNAWREQPELSKKVEDQLASQLILVADRGFGLDWADVPI